MELDEARGLYFFEGIPDDTLASALAESTEIAAQPGEVLWVEGEPTDYWWVLMVNAIDAMDGHGTLRVSTHVDGNRIVVDLGDTGSGTSPEIQERSRSPETHERGRVLDRCAEDEVHGNRDGSDRPVQAHREREPERSEREPPEAIVTPMACKRCYRGFTPTMRSRPGMKSGTTSTRKPAAAAAAT